MGSESRTQGLIAESEAYTYFVRKGFYVFVTFLEGAPFDYIVYRKDVGALKIEIKSCSRKVKNKNSESWTVCLKGGPTMYNSKGISANPDRKLDTDSFDILMIYLVKEDKFVFFKSEDIKQKRTLRLNTKNDLVEDIEELFGK